MKTRTFNAIQRRSQSGSGQRGIIIIIIIIVISIIVLTDKNFIKRHPHFASYFEEYKNQVEEMSVNISETVL